MKKKKKPNVHITFGIEWCCKEANHNSCKNLSEFKQCWDIKYLWAKINNKFLHYSAMALALTGKWKCFSAYFWLPGTVGIAFSVTLAEISPDEMILKCNSLQFISWCLREMTTKYCLKVNERNAFFSLTRIFAMQKEDLFLLPSCTCLIQGWGSWEVQTAAPWHSTEFSPGRSVGAESSANVFQSLVI